MGEPALPRRRKAPDLMIYAVRRRLPGNNFDKEQIRVQLHLLDANFDVVTVFGACDVYPSHEKVLSVTQPGRAVALLQFISRHSCNECFTVLKISLAE